MSKNTYLVVGGGGFIAGHLIKRLLNEGNTVIATDIKPKQFWFQTFDEVKSYADMDMKDYDNCLKVTKGVDYIFNLACNMGGMGFIENNKAECMLSVLINTNLLRASLENKVKKYFFSSSACVYNASKQKNAFIEGLKEEDAYPAMPEDGYGWEKLFSERLFLAFNRNHGLDVRIGRFHNIFGPMGTWTGGKEKAPAAMCRKAAEVGMDEYIEVWGDGQQTRSFLYIDECLEAVFRFMRQDNFYGPVNIGSEEMVTINQLVDTAAKVAGKNVEKEHILDAPLGVRGRNSNNDLIREKLGWDYSQTLEEGIRKTYNWIESQILIQETTDKLLQKV